MFDISFIGTQTFTSYFLGIIREDIRDIAIISEDISVFISCAKTA
jgi:hypothetical protein